MIGCCPDKLYPTTAERQICAALRTSQQPREVQTFSMELVRLGLLVTLNGTTPRLSHPIFSPCPSSSVSRPVGQMGGQRLGYPARDTSHLPSQGSNFTGLSDPPQRELSVNLVSGSEGAKLQVHGSRQSPQPWLLHDSSSEERTERGTATSSRLFVSETNSTRNHDMLLAVQVSRSPRCVSVKRLVVNMQERLSVGVKDDPCFQFPVNLPSFLSMPLLFHSWRG